MREAGAIADAGIMRAAEVMGPDVREADVMTEIVLTLARGANGHARNMHRNSLLVLWPRTGTSHVTWSEDLLRQGSQTNIENCRCSSSLNCPDQPHLLNWPPLRPSTLRA